MVDVVFLLLFFFMLASRFGVDRGLAVDLAGAGGDWTGPPRLVEVAPGGVTLNGVALPEAELAAALDRLVIMRSDPVVVAPRAGALAGDLVGVIDLLGQAGFSSIAVAP